MQIVPSIILPPAQSKQMFPPQASQHCTVSKYLQQFLHWYEAGGSHCSSLSSDHASRKRRGQHHQGRGPQAPSCLQKHPSGHEEPLASKPPFHPQYNKNHVVGEPQRAAKMATGFQNPPQQNTTTCLEQAALTKLRLHHS